MKNIKNNWFPLDNAGKLYPSIMSWRVSTLFRISATLTMKVEPMILQDAVENIIKRFPYFQVNLRPGMFWYYFDHTDKIPLVEKENFYPCMCMDLKKKGMFPFRVLYYNKRISVEFSHSISDGTGALIFLQCLLIEYFRLKGLYVNGNLSTFNYDKQSSLSEFEDSFKKYYNKNIPKPYKKERAFQFPMPLEEKGVYNIVTGIVPISEVLEKAKEKDVSLTEFILALYFDTILDFIKILPYKKRKRLLKPIILNVPVNLRKMYPSSTLRNFFISVTPSIDPRLGDYSFDEILKYVHSFMETQTHKRYINQQITRNVKSELSMLNRLFPLLLKNLILPIAYNYIAESRYTSGLSNMGKISLPTEIEEYVERFEIYPPPSEGNKIKMATIGFKNSLYITFGKVTNNNDIERIFFRKLRKMNIHVKIETNNIRM